MGELKPWIGVPPHTIPPALPGHQQVAHIKLDIVKVSLVGLVLMPAWAFVFMGVVALLGGRTSYEGSLTFGNLLGFAVLLVGLIVIHEAMHGLAAALLGAKPSFGVGPGFAYTTFLEPMPKYHYLFVGLAPFIIMSIASIAAAVIWPGIAGWAILFGVINAGGAIGDLWMSAIIVRYPREAMFYDLADGFAIYTPST